MDKRYSTNQPTNQNGSNKPRKVSKMKRISFEQERVIMKVLLTQHDPMSGTLTNWERVMEHNPRSVTAVLKTHKMIAMKYDPDKLKANYFVVTELGREYLAKYYPLVKERTTTGQ